MKKCPRCQIPLLRTQISEVNVLQCDKCRGNLVQLDRLNRIAATGHRSVPELMEDWKALAPIDTTARCRCPECRSVMEKNSRRGGVKFDHFECRVCQLLWLDPGELELYVLAYLVSDKGKEAQKFKDLHANMTEEEKAELKKMIDALPDDKPDYSRIPLHHPRLRLND